MAYSKCKWCYGDGCNQCEIERRKEIEEWEENGPQPIFTAKLNNPEEMQALKRVCGKEALEEAFGPDGGGIREIERNAAIETMIGLLREQNDTGVI